MSYIDDLPRGIRNNNPGNIRHSKDDWQGLSAHQPDKAFARFDHIAWGVRAAAKTVKTYQLKRGLDSVRKIIGRWAPPTENDTESYIRHVISRCTALQPFEQQVAVLLCIFDHENGRNWVGEEIVNAAVREAWQQVDIPAIGV